MKKISMRHHQYPVKAEDFGSSNSLCLQQVPADSDAENKKPRGGTQGKTEQVQHG